MPKPGVPERPMVTDGGSRTLRIAWAMTDMLASASTLKLRIVGSQKWQNYDHATRRLVPKGGSTIPCPTAEVHAEGVEEGVDYEVVVAIMNEDGWSDVSPPSEPAHVGELRPRAKPPAPEAPKFAPGAAKGKVKCIWTIPQACPPVEASQLRITAVAKGEKWLVDAANGKLVQSGRTTFAAARLEANICIEEGVEYVASICFRNAEGFGDYSAPSASSSSLLNGREAGMELVLHEGPVAQAPSLEPLTDGNMRVRWALPEDTTSTIVKVRRVGDLNWRLVGGATIVAPACEVVAPGFEEGIEYEALVSFLIAGRWSPDSPLSAHACIGEKKLPGAPGAAQEPRLLMVDQHTMRVLWRVPTAVPAVTSILVMFRALGGKSWQYLQPSTGQLLDVEAEVVPAPASEVDVTGQQSGVRYEAAIVLRNKLGTGPMSLPSQPCCLGRPIPRLAKCTYCFTDFDLQHSAYTKAPESFVCPPCRFRTMDPFNTVIEPYGLLFCHLATRASVEFELDLPDLKSWRKDDHSVWMRMVKIDADVNCQVWPKKIILEANSNELVNVKEPDEGHVRRDVPRNISAGLKPGKNMIKIVMDDEFIAGYALALVRCASRTVQQMASEISICDGELSKVRICSLVAEATALGSLGEEDDDEISCVISNRLKLRCPLSFERVLVPARGETCMHLQCFGLGAYLESNRKMRSWNNRWTCPVCGNALKPRDIRIDGYVERVLSETQSHVDEVLINADGEYKVLEEDLAPRPPRADAGPDGAPSSGAQGAGAGLPAEDPDAPALVGETIAVLGEGKNKADGPPAKRRRRRAQMIEDDPDVSGQEIEGDSE